MISYDTRNWYQVLTSVHMSGVIRRVLRMVLGIGVYAAGITWATQAGVLPRLAINATTFPVISILLSLLLAFRTNTAYDRWWEGRKLWSQLVNSSRSLGMFLAAILDEDDWESRRAFAADLSGFAAALRGHLRDGGARVEELEDLSPASQEELAAKDHLPLALAARITRRIHDLFRAEVVSGYELRNLKQQIEALVGILGECERIRHTPIPYSYNAYVKHLVFWFCMALPLGLQEVGYLSVPLSMVAFAAMVGLETLAGDIEDPFGSDENDLPTRSLSEAIRANVYETLLGTRPPGREEAPEPPPDRARVTVTE